MKEKLVIIFPGIGYHCDKPLLYYAKKLAKEHGYEEIVSLKYSYIGKNIRGNEKKMQEACDILYQQAEKQLELIDFSKYAEVVFISKSVGTVISSSYAQKYKIKCKQIFTHHWSKHINLNIRMQSHFLEHLIHGVIQQV